LQYQNLLLGYLLAIKMNLIRNLHFELGSMFWK